MAIFNSATVMSGGGGIKEDDDQASPFGNLSDILSANPDLENRLKALGADTSGVEGTREALELLYRSTDAQLSQLMGVSTNIRSGNRLAIRGNREWYKELLNKVSGDKTEADKLAQIDILKEMTRISVEANDIGRRMMAPGKAGLDRMAKILQESEDSATRNTVMDETEEYLRLHPEEGIVIPFYAEAFRKGIKGVGFSKDVIRPPVEDQFRKDPTAAAAFTNWIQDLGTMSVNADKTINDSLFAVVEGLKNIPGISELAVEEAFAVFGAAQKQALVSVGKDLEDEDADRKMEGRDFAISDSGVRHTSTDATDWRVDAGKDFENFRIFTALQKIGIVTREAQYTRDWDMTADMQRLSDAGGSVADLRDNPDIWDEATARGLDFLSGPFHTPYLLNNYVGVQDPDLLQRLKEHPEYRKIIGLEHMPSGSLDPEGNARSDLRKRREDLDAALKLSDDADSE